MISEPFFGFICNYLSSATALPSPGLNLGSVFLVRVGGKVDVVESELMHQRQHPALGPETTLVIFTNPIVQKRMRKFSLLCLIILVIAICDTFALKQPRSLQAPRNSEAIPDARPGSNAPASSSSSLPPFLSGQETQQQRKRHLDAVVFVSNLNMLINWFRPDKHISWQMRLPRICWEACIGIVAKAAMKEPSTMYLLSLMLGSTALIDIFLWGPIFGFATSFESCSGGGWFSGKPKVCTTDYTMGSSRLLASFQSIFGGLFYLSTAVTMWNNYWAIKVEYKVDRQMAAMAEILNRHQQEMLSGQEKK